MFLALTTLVTRLHAAKTLRPSAGRGTRAATAVGPATRQPPAPSRCFEVLVPYFDEGEAARKGLPVDSRHALVVHVWAPDVSRALACARERFQDLRRSHGRSARMAAEGPVALRIAREIESACAR